MSPTCEAPDPSLGVALRLSNYLDCLARVLGENGFQALAGGSLGASILSGLVTIFVALIGYRLIFGDTPGLRDGVGWTVRVGVVLALVTSWPAFQTLIYRVAVDGPQELAAIMLPASGLAADGLEWRVQQAYDTIRLGSTGQSGQDVAVVPAPPTTAADAALQATQPYRFQQPMPQTASLFVLTTSGMTAAFRIAVGFLLAIGPLAIMCLLFDATLGIFSGWIRALAGMTIASLAAIIVTAIDLTVVEGELAHLQAMASSGRLQISDPQGLTTIVLVFAAVMIVTTLAAARMTGAFRLPVARTFGQPHTKRVRSTVDGPATSVPQPARDAIVAANRQVGQSRVAGVAEALAATVRREQTGLVANQSANGSAHPAYVQGATSEAPGGSFAGLGLAGRRSIGRRTRAATRRDRAR